MKLCMLFTFLLIHLFSFSNEILNIRIGSYPPYTSENDPNARILEKVVKEVFALENITVLTSYYPWKRAYENVKAGSADILFPWHATPEAKETLIMTKEVLLEVNEIFFYNKNLNFNWNSLEDLKKYRIGATLGYNLVDIFKERDLQYEIAVSETLNFTKLLKNRIDLYATDYYVGLYLLQNEFSKTEANSLTFSPKPISKGKLYLMISKKTPNAQMIANKFDSGLLKLKKTGRYREIFEEYIASL